MATDASPIVAVHLGAQKTGSTWLHQLMQANAAAHAEASVRLVDRAEVRARITRPLLDRNAGRPMRSLAAVGARRWLAGEGRGAARLVISDENLIGGITEVLRTGMLYPSAERRMRAFARLLGAGPVALFLGIRPQDRFSSSLTAEAVRIGSARRQTPESIAERWWQNRPRWTPVVEALAKALPQATITVWDFDRLVSDPAAAVNALAGLPLDAPVTRRARFRRESLSGRAIEELLKIRDSRGVDAARAAEAEIRGRFPRSEDWPAFTLWEQNRADALRQDYAEDLLRIAALGPRVHLVTAPDPE